MLEFVDRGSDRVTRHIDDVGIQRIDTWSDIVDGCADSMSEEDRDALAKKVAGALRASIEKQVRRPLVEVELSAEGGLLVDGEPVADGPAMEAKLLQLAERTPPPDVRLKPNVGGDLLDRCQALLRNIGYGIVLYFERRGNEFIAVEGTIWRFHE